MGNTPRTRELFAEPGMPHECWLYIEPETRELQVECGTCGAWWYIQANDLLDAVVQCRACDLERYSRGFGQRSPRG